MAKQRVAKKAFPAPGVVKFLFTNGKVLTCELSRLSKEMYQTAADKGVGHRVGDSYSEAGKHTNPVQWAYETACATWELLCGGQWESEAETTGGIVAEALSRVQKITIEAAREKLSKLSEEKAKKVRKLLSETIAEIALERAKERAAKAEEAEDLDSLFDEEDLDEEEAA